MNNRNLLTPTNNDIKRGFGRSDQWKELLNVTKPLYYMNAKVMSKICARKTQQDAYTRQMMLFQQMSAVLICTSDKLRLLIIKYTAMDGRK
jgi:SNF2 family DNA or RNA helicase